jgi:hypothetical protein
MTNPTIQKLLLEAKKEGDRINELETELGIHNDTLRSIKIAIINERWGIGIGSEVIYRGSRHIIASMKLQSETVASLATGDRKPWMMGYRIKKDGKPTQNEFYLFGDWELPPKDETRDTHSAKPFGKKKGDVIGS